MKYYEVAGLSPLLFIPARIHAELARALVPRSVTVALALPIAAQLHAPASITAAGVSWAPTLCRRCWTCSASRTPSRVASPQQGLPTDSAPQLSHASEGFSPPPPILCKSGE